MIASCQITHGHDDLDHLRVKEMNERTGAAHLKEEMGEGMVVLAKE